MAKALRKPKSPTTKLAAVEKLFGPVLPGQSRPDRTISVFQEFSSPKKYKLFGRPGIVDGAIWFLHTVIPIDYSKIKGNISGILEEGNQHDPHRQQLASLWLNNHEETQRTANAAAEAKARAAARVGEFDAQLVIGGAIHETLIVRVKIDAKGKVKLVLPKGTSLQLKAR
jgi:hypothetical protein